MYLREVLGREDGAPPPVDLALERVAGDLIRNLIQSGQTAVVHDLSDGGLIAAVAEMALASKVGVALRMTSDTHAHILLFGEDQARYLVASADPDAILGAAASAGVHASVVGHAGGETLSAIGLFDIPLAKLRAAHEGWMPGFMGA
jgi:phosphoribosylformylglycinamidine synthase